MIPLNPVGVGLLYAVLSLDHFSFGPLLLSRPLIVGTAGGWLLNHPMTGFEVGAVGEALWALVPPTGPRQWDVGLMAALSMAWLGGDGAGTAAVDARWALALAGLIAFPLGLLGRRVDAWARKQTRPFAARALEGLARGSDGPLRASLALTALLWIFKSWVVFLVFESFGGALWDWGAARLPGVVRLALDRTWTLWMAVGAGSLLWQFLGRWPARAPRPGIAA